MSGNSLGRYAEKMWYGSGLPAKCWLICLTPLAWLYTSISACRRAGYSLGLFKTHQFSVPVVVVGNITVGGTGKTPVVVALVERLRKAGWSPGVVSRGYGGEAPEYPCLVTEHTAIEHSGDEPGLIARRVKCPVMVDPRRSRAVKELADKYDVNIIVSDDGLQHYAMARDAELAIVDAGRRLGNGGLLPAGPLRESARRLNTVDAVIVNGGNNQEASMSLLQLDAVNLVDGTTLPLQAFKRKRGHAMAGIGNPGRFFDQLVAVGLDIERHAFSDHHRFEQADLSFSDESWVLMTEKDAVKCRAFATEKCWYVPVDAKFNALAETMLNKLIQSLGKKRNEHG